MKLKAAVVFVSLALVATLAARCAGRFPTDSILRSESAAPGENDV